MPNRHRDYRLDARPDRVDFRDYEYRAPLHSLPSHHPDDTALSGLIDGFADSGLVLDQGKEGACTGFGLAAVIHLLHWYRSADPLAHTPVKLSTRMLYHMARFYDEWPGEDYDGSSCRGAMKGWHRHGVCTDALWPYRNDDEIVEFVQPNDQWASNAAQRPLGAYYRVDKDSIMMIQSALNEVGAVYASATVHAGWYLDEESELVEIPHSDREVGNHAFAIVGYRPEGFIILNSWGPDWGFKGFAILSYEDWIATSHDAWVAVMGAPIAVTSPPESFSHLSLGEHASGLRAGDGERRPRSREVPQALRPWSQTKAYRHCVVLANNGRPINRLVDSATPEHALDRVVQDLPRSYLTSPERDAQRIMIYAHGGLTEESEAVEQAQVLGPYLEANGIYPIFLIWRTGLWELLDSWLEDRAVDLFTGTPAAGPLDDLAESLREARDRAIEVVAARSVPKALWTETKQNALASVRQGRGLSRLASGLESLIEHLETVSPAGQKPEIHLAGYSAGALISGLMLDKLRQIGQKASSLQLIAPGCNLEFANRYIGGAEERGVLDAANMHVYNLTSERERKDRVGPYGKSILYLVSRGLEDEHRTPILGMADAWDPNTAGDDTWYIPAGDDENADVRRWTAGLGSRAKLHTFETSEGSVIAADNDTDPTRSKLKHTSMDNDLALMQSLIERAAGEITQPVLDLRGL